MRLPGDGFLLRPFAPSDALAIARHANDREVWRNLKDLFPHPYELPHAEEWIARISGQDGPPRALCIEVDGEASGVIGIGPKEDVFAHTAAIGYWLARPHWGRGIVTAAVGLMTRYAFENFDLARLEAGIYEWNTASGRVLEKNGFVLEGRHRRAAFKDGEFVDVLMYALLRDD